MLYSNSPSRTHFIKGSAQKCKGKCGILVFVFYTIKLTENLATGVIHLSQPPAAGIFEFYLPVHSPLHTHFTKGSAKNYK